MICPTGEGHRLIETHLEPSGSYHFGGAAGFPSSFFVKMQKITHGVE